MVRIADRADLFETVCHNFRQRQERRIDFLFVRIVRTDGGDKGSRSNVFFVNIKFYRRRAGDNDVAALDRTRKTADRLNVGPRFARKFHSQRLRGVWIDIEGVNFSERKHQRKRAKVSMTLLATTTDRRDG